MPATEAERQKARAAEVFEMAQMGIQINLGVSATSAAQILVREAARVLPAAAVKSALKTSRRARPRETAARPSRRGAIGHDRR
jgi:hypothetical protein